MGCNLTGGGASLPVAMRCLRPLLLVLFLSGLHGCPAAPPAADQFADAQAQADKAGQDTLGQDTLGQDLAAADAAAPLDSVSADSSGPDAPAPDTTSQDTLGGDTATVKKPCSTGLELFAKEFDDGGDESAHAILATAEGGAVLLGGNGNGGSSSNALAIRVSPLGGVVWAKELGGADMDRFRAGAVSASGFVAVGSTRSLTNGQDDGWLVQLDSTGKAGLDQHYGGAGNDEFLGIAPAPSGWVMAGSTRSAGNGQEEGWLVRTDVTGQQLWEQNYGGSSIDTLAAVIALPNGTFAAVGENMSSAKQGSDAWLLIVQGNGKQLISKTYHMGEHDFASAVAALPDGGLIFTGQASVNGNPELWVVRTDAEGNQLWKDVVTGNQSETGRAVTVLADGGWAVAGDTSSSIGGSLGGIDAWLLRYDAWGNRLWDKHFGSSGNEWFSGVAALGDGGLWLGGRRFASGGLNAWYARVNAWGHSSCAAAGACKDKAGSDCQDQQPCTVDLCDPADGCSHLGLAPGSACGAGLVCAPGGCQ